MQGRYSNKNATEKKLRYLGRENWVLELRTIEMLLNFKYHYYLLYNLGFQKWDKVI